MCSVFKNDIVLCHSDSISIRQLKHNCCFVIQETFLEFLATCLELKEHQQELMAAAVFL